MRKSTKKNQARTTTPPRTIAQATAPEESAEETAANGTVGASGERIPPKRLRKMSIPELQAAYLAIIKRESTSTNRAYLMNMIRKAQQGYVPIGPRVAKEKEGPKVHLPLRMNKDDVPVLDEVWERHGLVSRSELFRRALYKELTAMGEEAAAALFAEEEVG